MTKCVFILSIRYHLECLEPPLDEVPEGNWYCPQCEPIVRRSCELISDAALSADSANEESDDGTPSSVGQVGKSKVQPETTARVSVDAKGVDSKAGIIAGLVDGNSQGKKRSKSRDQLPVITSPSDSASGGQGCSIVAQHQSCLMPGSKQVVFVSDHEGQSGSKRLKLSGVGPFIDLTTSDNEDQCISLRRGGFLVDRRKAKGRKMKKRVSLPRENRDSRPLTQSRNRARTVATGSSPRVSIRRAVIASQRCSSSQDGLLAAQQIAQGVWQSPDRTVQHRRDHYGCPALYPMVKNLSFPHVGYLPASHTDSTSFKAPSQVQELSSHSFGSALAARGYSVLTPTPRTGRCAQAALIRHKVATSKSSANSQLPLTPQSGPIRHTASQTRVSDTSRLQSPLSTSKLFKPQKLDFSR